MMSYDPFRNPADSIGRLRASASRPLGPFSWRVRVLRATPTTVTTETTAHLVDDQGRSRCGLDGLTTSRPAAISATRCKVCSETRA